MRKEMESAPKPEMRKRGRLRSRRADWECIGSYPAIGFPASARWVCHWQPKKRATPLDLSA